MIRTLQKVALLAAMALISQGSSSAEANPARVKVNIEAQGLKQALTQFAEQTGIQILQREEDASAAGLRAPKVVGELSPREALDRLLADTKLRYEFVNERTVRISSPAATSSVGRAEPTIRLTQATDVRTAQAASNPQQVEMAQESKTGESEMEVTGSRIDGLTNKSLLPTDREAPVYHSVITREDIDRLGITTMEDLFRFIPQTSSAQMFSQGVVGGIPGGERTPAISLRGLPSTQTTILVNNRPLPRMMHTSSVGAGGADFSRIPIAAVERIEILPYAGSAIYGAGAIGGAINIIMRKNYDAQDLTANVGASVNGSGGEEYGLTYLRGLSWNDGKTNLSLTASANRREPLYHGDRDYLDRAIDRYGPTSTARIGTSPTSATAFQNYIIPALSGSPATIVVSASDPRDLGIPGRPGVRWATVPLGTTAEQSFNLTPASFAGTAGNYTTAAGHGRWDRFIINEPQESYSILALADHQIIPKRLKAYGEFSLSRTAASYTASASTSVNLAANDPMNPFNNTRMGGGTAGRPVTVYFDTPDIPDEDYDRQVDSYRVLLGLEGEISKSWAWSVDAVLDSTVADFMVATRASNVSGLQALDIFDNPNIPEPPQPAAVRRAIYPILADHSRYPISRSTADLYFGSGRYTPTDVEQKDLSMKLTGSLFNLPAGEVRSALNVRLRNYERTSSFATLRQDEYYFMTNGAYPTSPVAQQSPITSIRDTQQATIEMTVPIFGRNWHPVPFVEGLDLNLVHSRERSATSGLNQSSQDTFDLPFTDPTRTNVIALKWTIVRDLAFRGSFSEGLYPPDWNDVSDAFGPQFGNTILSDAQINTTVDPLRGNLTLRALGNTRIEEWNGGNPSLRPETAETVNLGMIFNPRFLPGLSMTVDWTRTEKIDAITFTSYNGILSRLQDYSYPSVSRRDPSPTDIANGWAGEIIFIGTGYLNLASLKVESIDSTIRYDYEAGDHGNFMFSANASYFREYAQRTTPVSLPRDTISAGGPNRLRGNASLSWEKNRFGATVTALYVDKFYTNQTGPSVNFPNAISLDAPYIPSWLSFDLSLMYSLEDRRGGSMDWLLDGSQFKLKLANVFNKMPAFVSDGSGFYNRSADPRQRFLTVEYRKSF